jgi:hypothetical protein
MITINLLPEEFRRRERTPIRIFAATMAAAAVLAGLGGTLAFLWFGKLATAEAVLARLEEDRTGMEPQLKHHAALSAEVTETEKWQQTLRELRNNRIPWTRKLDQFIDLVSQSGDQGKYMIWFTDFSVQQSIDNKSSGGTVAAKGMSSSDDVGKVASFMSDLKRHECFDIFAGLSGPEGKVPEGSADVVEFPMLMTLASRDPRKPANPANPGTQSTAAPTPNPQSNK